MLILISSSKTLDFSKTQSLKHHTIPVFIKESEELISILKDYNSVELMKLMKVSRSIADTNFNRFKKWNSLSMDKSKIALMAFKGDVYENIKAGSLTTSDCEFANRYVRIISGLYGLLRPLDLIQPYRLEMGTKLPNDKGPDLYKFWKAKVTHEIRKVAAEKNLKIVLNLASREYFKVVDEKSLGIPVVTVSFKQKHNSTYKTFGLHSKKARGQMVNYIIKNRIECSDSLKEFTEDGYTYNPEFSSDKEWVYTR